LATRGTPRQQTLPAKFGPYLLINQPVKRWELRHLRMVCCFDPPAELDDLLQLLRMRKARRSVQARGVTQPTGAIGGRRPSSPSTAKLGESGRGTTVAILITASIVVVVLVVLLFVGSKWVKPESLRLKIWNWLEFEMRGQDEPEPPKRAIKRS
jgi:hypothetical protein